MFEDDGDDGNDGDGYDPFKQRLLVAIERRLLQKSMLCFDP